MSCRLSRPIGLIIRVDYLIDRSAILLLLSLEQPVGSGAVYALRKGGVRYRNPYQTRHTWASMMLSAGEHPMWVASQMGHKDWGMIRRHYGRWIPDADPTAGGRAVAHFYSKNADQTGPKHPKI